MIIYTLFFKTLIMSNLLLFNIFSLFLSNLMMIWFFMEISNFLFITLMMSHMKYKKMIFLYFIIQVISSSMIIFMIILNILMNKHFYLNFMMIIPLLLKLNIPPFHLWLPLICKSLPWKTIIILLTVQKLSPFYFISLLKMPILLLYMILILTSLIPPYMLINNTNIKMLMAYSSINHSGWMIMLINTNNTMWFKYFIFYTLIMYTFLNMIYYYKMFMNMSSIPYINLNILPMIFMFNLAGMPPFSFFFMKWYSMFLMIYSSNLFFILILMMMSSLIMMYIYISMMIYFMFMNKFIFKFFMTSSPLTHHYNFNFFWKFLALSMSLIILII
uniref:NADH dehydrogenase subunit 2 n=1 Tax=Stenamma muralla TaxID=1504015 RepID=UPI001FCD8193|nr:NADH dehydrogenase subunit 2 [Stenamma muralla]UNZ99579.1 NADH dehydrogenase subunit 2 [Stenamma muralla]